MYIQSYREKTSLSRTRFGACAVSAIIFCAALLVSSCDLFPFLSGSPTVYAAGYYGNGSNDVASMWKDGTRTDFPDVGGYKYEAYSVFVSGADVYVAGSLRNFDSPNKFAACYWKNGARTELTNFALTADARARSIVVASGKVYVAGFFFAAGPLSTASLWTDGLRTSLESGGNPARALSVAVSGADVYVAGFYMTGPKEIPCYWKNGTRHDLAGDGAHDARAVSIAVSSGNVYAAGYYKDGTKDIACYWKDGVRTNLPGDGSHDAQALSLVIADAAVYASGYYRTATHSIACYWKNGARTDLPGGTATFGGTATSISVNGGTVYNSGYIDNGTVFVPCTWKGTARTDLSSGGSPVLPGFAMAISVN
jgi:hypothetical protein